jgi:hypothetical protein
VRPGLHGAHPPLERLTRGDLDFTCDLRRVYTTLLDWLGAGAAAPAILGGRFEPLAIAERP